MSETVERSRTALGPSSGVTTKFVMHYLRGMKNVTVVLDESVARWARVRAAELDTSVSRLLGDLLRREMERELTYQTEWRQYVVREPQPLSQPGSVYPTRDSLHDRGSLR